MASTFTICGGFFYVKHKQEGLRRHYGVYLAFCILAGFSKENGLVSFYIIPFLYSLTWLKKINKEFVKQNKERFVLLLKELAVSTAISIAYFTIRFLLRGEIKLGNESYSIKLFSLEPIKNIALLLFASLTAIDSLAFFVPPRNYFLLIVSVVLSLPFLLYLLLASINVLKKREYIIPFIGIVLCILASALPNAITTTGEMHAYVLMATNSLLLCFLITNGSVEIVKPIKIKNFLYISLAIFFAVSILSMGRKWSYLYENGKEADRILNNISEEYHKSDAPQSILFVFVGERKKPYYSIFYVSDKSELIAGGRAAESIWGWKQIDIKKIYLEKDDMINDAVLVEINKQEYDAVFVVNVENGAVRNFYKENE